MVQRSEFKVQRLLDPSTTLRACPELVERDMLFRKKHDLKKQSQFADGLNWCKVFSERRL